MIHLDLTLPSPEDNLAADEWLLDHCESSQSVEILRFWEPRQSFVVLGHGNRLDRNVRIEECKRRSIPILRRISGGGTVIQTPGCLNYSLILRISSRADLHTVTGTNRFVMERLRAAIEFCAAKPVAIAGHTDLILETNRKFSGNAQRRRRRFLLFHGCLLLNADLTMISRLLTDPERQPDYREGREHGDFLTNLETESDPIKNELCRVWDAAPYASREMASRVDLGAIRDLARTKYLTRAWTFKL